MQRYFKVHTKIYTHSGKADSKLLNNLKFEADRFMEKMSWFLDDNKQFFYL
jgi:hypothetical protein